MPWPKTGATHYHAQLGLLRQRLCNQRVGCLMGERTLYTAIISGVCFEVRGVVLIPKRHQAPYIESSLSKRNLQEYMTKIKPFKVPSDNKYFQCRQVLFKLSIFIKIIVENKHEIENVFFARLFRRSMCFKTLKQE